MGVEDHVEEVTHLFFTNDGMLFCELDRGTTLNLKFVLMGFQAVSRLSINFPESKMVRLES